MNANQIINMIIRIVMRRVINHGINAGINRVSGGRKQQRGRQKTDGPSSIKASQQPVEKNKEIRGNMDAKEARVSRERAARAAPMTGKNPWT